MEINEMEMKERERRERAKKRVEEIKGFYIHLTVYIIVNTSIATIKIVKNVSDGQSFGEAFWDFGNFAVWFFWGIGLIFHGLKTFSHSLLLGKEWEERQIKKYIEKEKQEASKYTK